jgi:hypothetical protein
MIDNAERLKPKNENLAALRRDVKAGLDDLEAGRASDGEDVFRRLKRRFPAG